MKRLTFEGLFCDIAKCDSTPGGTFCESGTCTQRRVWERLKEYEDTGLEPEQVMELKSFAQGGIHKVDDGMYEAWGWFERQEGQRWRD